MHGIGVVQHMTNKGVTALVIGDGGALLLAHHARLALRTGDDALHRLFNLVHRNQRTAAARRKQRGLVQQVRQVGAGKAHGKLGELIKAHVLVQRLVLRMDAQDLLAALNVGAVHGDLAIEASGTQQGGVQDVGAVGGGDQDDRLGLLKAVHLNQQLVQRLLALVMSAAQTSAALATDGVDLIDKDNRGRLRLGLGKQVAHAACAHAHKHFDKVRTGNAKERYARLAGNRFGKQRLTGTRRANQQHAARNLGTQLAEALRLAQEVADLLKLFDRLIDAGNVLELHLGPRGLVGLGVGLAKLHGLVVGAHHLPHEIEHKEDQDHRGKQAQQHVHKRIRVVRVHHIRGLRVLGHKLGQGIRSNVCGRELLELVFVANLFFRGPIGAVHRAVNHRIRGARHAVVLDGAYKVAGSELARLTASTHGVAHVEEHVGKQGAHQQHIEPIGTRRAAARALGSA